MSTDQPISHFEAKLERPAQQHGADGWCFILIPREVSDTLPRRGRTTVNITLNHHSFQATLEPDGQLSHWLVVSQEWQQTAEIKAGDKVAVELSPLEHEPEPELPIDWSSALKASPEALRVWESTTTLARIDWIHWIVTAKQLQTRAKRIRDACKMLASGKKRVCCFDPSGFYSKALSAPKPLA